MITVVLTVPHMGMSTVTLNEYTIVAPTVALTVAYIITPINYTTVASTATLTVTPTVTPLACIK